MAVVVPDPGMLNLTEGVLSDLTRKLAVEPEIREVEVSENGSVTQEQTAAVVEILPFPGFDDVYKYMPVRSGLHKDSVELRQELQLHIRSVVTTGDEMLTKIRLIVEELDTATHSRNLAIQELKVVKIEHDQLKLRFELVSAECDSLKATIIDISKQRDFAEISLETVKGELLQKTEECIGLKRESVRLHEQITRISAELDSYVSRLARAESDVRQYITELESVKDELEKQKRKTIEIENIKIVLQREIEVLRAENKDFTMRYEKVKFELNTTVIRLENVTKQLIEVKADLQKAIITRDLAIVERDEAIKDRDVAYGKAREAIEFRDDAIRSRDQAIYTENATRQQWLIDSTELATTRKSLKIIQLRVETITTERNEAILNADRLEHLRDEAIENFRDSDCARHRLQKELDNAGFLVIAAEKKVDAARAEVIEVERKHELTILAKEQVELVLLKTEREKNSTIAELFALQRKYIEADKDRDEALAKFKAIEDSYQNAQKDLVALQGKLELSQHDEIKARFDLEKMTNELKKSQESEAALTHENKGLSDKLKVARSAASDAKRELADKVGRLQADNQHLQKDLDETKASEKVFMDQVKDSHAQNEILRTELADTKKEAETYKKQCESPISKSANGIVIRHIFFDGVRLESPKVYQNVMNSAVTVKEGAKKFTVDLSFVDPEKKEKFDILSTQGSSKDKDKPKRKLAIYYAVTKNGNEVDRPAQVIEEGCVARFEPRL